MPEYLFRNGSPEDRLLCGEGLSIPNSERGGTCASAARLLTFDSRRRSGRVAMGTCTGKAGAGLGTGVKWRGEK